MTDLSKLIELIQAEPTKYGKIIVQNGIYWVVKVPAQKEQQKNPLKNFQEE